MKKIRNYLKTITLLMVTALVMVTMNYCNKTNTSAVDMETPNDQAELFEESEAIIEHILAFKTRMELFKANPGLKTEIKYTADEAVMEVENLINLDFGYGMLEINKQEIITTEITMSLDELSKIGDSDLSQFYYDQAVEEIKNQMVALDGYSNMKLMLVDLEYKETNSNGDAVISINAFIGNQGLFITPTSTETGWMFGFEYGDCDGNGTNDAAILLENEVNQIIYTPCPPNQIIITNVATTLYDDPTDPEFINTDDDILENNYQDRLIFYATSEYNDPDNALTPDDRCVSTDLEIGWNLEMSFYNESYNTIGENAMIENNGNRWNIDIIEFDGVDPDNTNYKVVKHDLIIMSHHFYCCPNCTIEPMAILEY